MPPEATTQKGQLDAFFAALGVDNFTAAIAAISAFKANSQNAQNWTADQKAFFDLLGAKDQAGAISALTAIKSDRDALFEALGKSPDVAGAIGVINNMNADRNALWKALGATDHSTALNAITTLNGRVKTAEDAQKDFDSRLEAGIQKGVIDRAASAGLPTPVAKVAPTQPAPGEAAASPRRRLGQLFNEQIGTS